MKKENVLYLGNYLDESIIKTRGLPTRNVAGTNRMHRIAQALNVRFQTLIVSPGISLRIKKTSHSLLLHSKKVHVDGVEVCYAASIAIPYLCLLVSYVTYLVKVMSLILKKRPKVVVIYNFDPLSVILCTFIKLFFWRITVVNNIEDVSIPRLKDFSKTSEDRGFQQYVFYVCMKYIAYLSHAYIIPTKRFIPYLPAKKRVIVITGCIPVSDFKPKPNSQGKLNLLFSGKIAFEHGIDVFIEALSMLENKIYHNQIEVHVSGGGNKVDWLKTSLQHIKGLSVTYHGFVSNEEYRQLLQKADVCVALQKELGRHAQFNTPSKVYEYLGHAKVVIATNVGDLSEMGEDIIKICSPLTPDHLVTQIESILKNRAQIEHIKNNVHTFAKTTFDVENVGEKLYAEILK